jgi:hypothetical protein
MPSPAALSCRGRAIRGSSEAHAYGMAHERAQLTREEHAIIRQQRQHITSMLAWMLLQDQRQGLWRLISPTRRPEEQSVNQPGNAPSILDRLLSLREALRGLARNIERGEVRSMAATVLIAQDHNSV